MVSLLILAARELFGEEIDCQASGLVFRRRVVYKDNAKRLKRHNPL
jgi:hypothetical protein